MTQPNGDTMPAPIDLPQPPPVIRGNAPEHTGRYGTHDGTINMADHPLHKDHPDNAAPVSAVPPEVAPVPDMSAPGVSGALTTYVDENGAVVNVFEATPVPDPPA